MADHIDHVSADISGAAPTFSANMGQVYFGRRHISVTDLSNKIDLSGVARVFDMYIFETKI